MVSQETWARELDAKVAARMETPFPIRDPSQIKDNALKPFYETMVRVALLCLLCLCVFFVVRDVFCDVHIFIRKFYREFVVFLHMLAISTVAALFLQRFFRY